MATALRLGMTIRATFTISCNANCMVAPVTLFGSVLRDIVASSMAAKTTGTDGQSCSR